MTIAHAMSFDKDHQSPDQLVDPSKRTTKVNVAVAIGVLIFLTAMAVFVWRVAKNPPQDPESATQLPVENGK